MGWDKVGWGRVGWGGVGESEMDFGCGRDLKVGRVLKHLEQTQPSKVFILYYIVTHSQRICIVL